ncbi:MAG: hypothetical protein J6S78_01190 [Lachnospiraceae bacterium]|nr:hypothetical protein [Lachnospiraceae bacterium]
MKTVRKLTIAMLVICMACSMVGCKKKKMSDEEYLKLAETKAEQNKKKVLLKLTSTDGTTYDITAYDMVYFLAYNERSALEFQAKQNDYYIAMYGTDYDFWNITDSSGIKIKEGYKETAYATAAYAYIFYMEAKKNGVELEESRRAGISLATEKFLLNYTPEQRAKCGMTEACIRENYEKVFLAEQYIDKLTKDVVIDEEAVRATVDKEDYRVYETDFLYVAKYDTDENFHRVDFSDEEVEERRAGVYDALERTKNGEDMIEIRKDYERFMGYGTSDFFRTQVDEDPDYNNAAMALKKGECVLFERDSRYYIIYMEDNEKFKGYEEAVEKAIETKRNTYVAEINEELRAKYDIAKTEEWESITMGDYALIK